MNHTLTVRAKAAAELMRYTSGLGLAVEVEDDGSVWLHGPGENPGRKIGSSLLEAVRHFKQNEMSRHHVPRP